MLSSKQIFHFGFLFLLSSATVARKIQNTGGGIVFEEAWTIPELTFQIRFVSNQPLLFSPFVTNRAHATIVTTQLPLVRTINIASTLSISDHLFPP